MQPDSKLWGVLAGLEGTARLLGGGRGLQSLQHQQVTRAHVPQTTFSFLSACLKIWPLKFQLCVSLCFLRCLFISLSFYINGISLKMLAMHPLLKICSERITHVLFWLLLYSAPPKTSEYDPYSFNSSFTPQVISRPLLCQALFYILGPSWWTKWTLLPLKSHHSIVTDRQ